MQSISIVFDIAKVADFYLNAAKPSLIIVGCVTDFREKGLSASPICD